MLSDARSLFASGVAGRRGSGRAAGDCQDSQAPLAARHLDITWGRSVLPTPLGSMFAQVQRTKREQCKLKKNPLCSQDNSSPM